MNIAYLDPPYSRYFQRLSARVAARTGGEVTALLSTPAYRLYAPGDRVEVWPAGGPSADFDVPSGFGAMAWAAVDDPHFRETFGQAVIWLRERFQRLRIGLCLVYSDARPFSAAASVAARDTGTTCLYFERGAFRMATTSLSTLGLNARFSLQRAMALRSIQGATLPDAQQRRPTETMLRARFAAFISLQAAALTAEPARRRLQHRDYEFRRYARLALSQARRRIQRPSREVPPREDGEPLIVVPLQLESDSQFTLHSPFRSNQALLDTIARGVKAVAPRAHVVFKAHPMGSRHYRLPDNTIQTEGNLARYFGGQDVVVVCVNSTMGFEAAAQGLRVVCFGPSFYSDSTNVTLATPDNFPARLAAALRSERDPAAGRALREALLRWYQAPGDVWAYDNEDLERTAAVVLQHHAAVADGARAAAAAARAAPVSAVAFDRAIA